MAQDDIPLDRALWTLDTVRKLAPSNPLLASNLAMLNGEHSIDTFYMGPGEDALGVISETTKAKIEKKKIPVPEAAACVETRVTAVCRFQADLRVEPKQPEAKEPGKEGEPARQVPSERQKEIAAQRIREDGDWWDRDSVSFWEAAKQVVRYGSANPVDGTACFRLFWNPASRTKERATEDGVQLVIPEQPNMEAAGRHIEITVPDPSQCFVHIDPDTHQKTGVFLYTERGSDKKRAEIWYTEGEDTVWRIVGDDLEAQETKRFRWDGFLPIVQVRVGTLLTEPVLRNQAALDAASTGLGRNALAHGYTQRSEIDARRDGFWMETPPVTSDGMPPETFTDTSGKTWYFHPTAAEMSPSIIRNIYGDSYVTHVDEKGIEHRARATPQIHIHEPSDPENITKNMVTRMQVIRHYCKQGHISTTLAGHTVELSGEAYEQARAIFQADIDAVGDALSTGIAQVFSVRACMCETLMGLPEARFVREYRYSAECHPSAGPVSPDRQRANAELADKGYLSKETVLARNGENNVRGELDRIEAQPLPLDKQIERANMLRQGGADPVAAYMFVGISEEWARKLARSDGEPFIVQ